MKKAFLVFTLLTCFVAATFAADEKAKKEEKWKKPSSSQICFVVRVALQSPINMDFYAIGVNANPDKRGDPARFGFVTEYTTDGYFPIYGNLGEMTGINIAKKELKDADNGFYLPAFGVQLFNVRGAHFHLPINMDISYPRDAKYVYLGTYIFTLGNTDLSVKSVRRVDEYEAAQKLLNEKLGTEVQLIRAELSEHKETKKK